jgi:integrase
MRLGVRSGEARALDVGDWRPDYPGTKHGALIVRRAAKGPLPDAPLRGTKTGSSRPVPADVDLKRWLRKHAPKSGALFVNPLGRRDGKRWSANGLTLEWKRAAEQVGGIASLYEGTKHSTASAAINGGMALDAIQAALGHADARSTRQ